MSPHVTCAETETRANEGAASSAGLSIVIVNWNTKDLLLQVLGDVLPWACERDCEIVVVDNASGDGSVEAARERWPQLRYLVQAENLGFAGGVNKGFEAAKNDWVLLLNTDVRCDAAGIDALCAYGDANPHVGVVGPCVRNEDGSYQDSYWRFPTLWRLFCSSSFLYKILSALPLFNSERYGGTRFAKATAVDAVSGCVFLYRRALLERIGGLDDSYFMYFEETDLCKRVHAAGSEVHYAPVADFVHFLGGSSRLARRRNFLEFRRSLRRFHRKHGGFVAESTARCLLGLGYALRLLPWGILSCLPGSKGKAARQQFGLYCAAFGDLFRSLPSHQSR